MDEIITLNVAFNITNPLHDLIVNSSLEIRDKYCSDWYIDEDRYHLHFPMYLFAAPERNEQLIVETCTELHKVSKRLKTVSTGLFHSQSGLVMIKFSLPEEVLLLHEKAVALFNPLREGIVREKYKDELFLSKLDPKNREYLRVYGSQWVFENYQPHITIARIKDPGDLSEILNTYNDRFIGVESELDRLQVHKAIFSENKEEDRTVLLFDEKI